MVRVFTFLVFVCLLPFGANAQVKEKVFRDWTVYSTTLQGKKTCYVASFPKSKSGNYKRRDDPYFLVTRISNNISEVSTSSGYKYKKNSDVRVNLEGQNFNMFTKDEIAWASDEKQDNAMVSQMKAKNFMKVRGTSIKGTYSVDKYSLSGFTKAFDYMHELCR